MLELNWMVFGLFVGVMNGFYDFWIKKGMYGNGIFLVVFWILMFGVLVWLLFFVL